MGDRGKKFSWPGIKWVGFLIEPGLILIRLRIFGPGSKLIGF